MRKTTRSGQPLLHGILTARIIRGLYIEHKVIVETKTAPHIGSAHELQLFNYLKAARLEVGLILNFGPKPNFQRYVFTRHDPPDGMRASPS